jgi:D-amino peptidase
MRFIVRTDMEGVTGVTTYDQVVPGRADYAYGQKMFMADLLALINGLNDGGADKIVLYDEHYDGRNILVSMLPDNTTAVCGKPNYTLEDPGCLSRDCHGLIMLGFHGKAGTKGATLPHSYEHDHADIRINGISVGEIGVESAIAGDFNVPLIMVVGDSAGVAEAQALIPGVLGVVTKRTIGESSAECYPQARTLKTITQAAQQLVQSPPRVKPFKHAPVTLEVELHDGAYLTRFKQLFASKMSNNRTVRLTGKNATDAWVQYWNLKEQAKE